MGATALTPLSFMDAKAFSHLKATTRGEFVGIGVELSMEKETIRIVASLNGGPAAQAGLRAGDVIVAVNGRTTTDHRAWPE
ncbi:MAG: carboxyl-terminal processing protease [Rhodospirillaceae bacterium]|nr:MAG: carboxyl-terminal processing protease [Rhodospirillaceae bacterium]